MLASSNEPIGNWHSGCATEVSYRMKPSILFIVPAQYDELKTKGVESMIYERDEGGFFGKVITVHPFSNKTRSIVLNETHEIHEIGFDLIPGANRFRALKYLQAPLHLFRIISTTVRLARKHKVSLIRANDPYWMGLFAWVTAKLQGSPYCVSIHADYDKRMALDDGISIVKVFGSYALARHLERFVFRGAAMVLPIRESLATQAVAHGARSDSIRVIPHGIDLEPVTVPPRNDIRSRFFLGANTRIISFVGRISRDNYVSDMVEAVSRLASRRSDFVFVMAGAGKEEVHIKQIVMMNRMLAGRVVLAGFQPREVCHDLRRASAVSLCLMGGFSLIEACAAASPVVSYDVEWHGELVKNGETGFLVREGDIEGVVTALDWLLDHPGEGENMGQKAKALAFERHSLANASATKVRWYTQLLVKAA